MSHQQKATNIISINQPAYLPWLGYFERIANSDHHIVLDHVQFEKNSMTNRNKILTANGELTLTVPVKTSGKFGSLMISDIAISEQHRWQKKHWQSIYFNYKKASYFKKYQDDLEEMYTTPWSTLNSLLKAQLSFFMKALTIETRISYSSDFQWQDKKSDLILEMCQQFNASHYLSGMHGQDYLQTEAFEQNNIEVLFQHYQHPEYRQLCTQFTSHLSILDLLLNHGNKSLNILRSLHE